MTQILKRPLFYIIVTPILLITALSGYFLFRTPPVQYETTTVKRGDIIQQVSVTGIVKPSESVELSFEKSGKVISTPVKVGDTVKRDQLLVMLEGRDLNAEYLRAVAGVDSARAMRQQYEAALLREQTRLEEMKKGTRAEELSISETSVANAKNSVNDATRNLDNVTQKNASDFTDAYNSALFAAQSAVSTAQNALYTITDIQSSYFSLSDSDSLNIAINKARAVLELLGGIDGGKMGNAQLSGLNGGAKKLVEDARVSNKETDINTAITAVKSSLQRTKETLDAIPVTSSISATDLTKISTAKSNINSEISTVSLKIQSITSQKALNQNSLSTAQSSLNAAQNNLALAESELTLKRAGYTAEQIRSQESTIKQAESNLTASAASLRQAQAGVSSASAQLAKNAIRSPIDGIVTEQNAKTGEIISPNMPVVKIMAVAKFEIEANVPEVDIAKIKIGNIADVTLDAYTTEDIFKTNVISIDPAEKIVEGVPTYKVTLQFETDDERVKSGMTANVEISTDKRENVLSVPTRAVLSTDGKKIVRTLTADNQLQEIQVTTGLRGSDGQIEIIEGLTEKQTIVTYVKQ